MPRGVILAILIPAAFLFGGSWVARETMLRGVATLWIVSDKIEPADAIVVLGGAPDVRPPAAAALYNNGFANQILISNTSQSTVLKLEGLSTEVNREFLLKLRVPPSAISYFGHDLSSTYEETRALLAWAKSSGAKSVIVPTDLFSTRRLRWMLGREFSAAGIYFSVQAVSSPRYTANDWWIHQEGRITFRNELIKYLYYRLRY
jgi:uncharacterized SAM-binding protein YcdF (DUF218 family)